MNESKFSYASWLMLVASFGFCRVYTEIQNHIIKSLACSIPVLRKPSRNDRTLLASQHGRQMTTDIQRRLQMQNDLAKISPQNIYQNNTQPNSSPWQTVHPDCGVFTSHLRWRFEPFIQQLQKCRPNKLEKGDSGESGWDPTRQLGIKWLGVNNKTSGLHPQKKSGWC